MLDAEDRAVISLWGIRLAAVVVGMLSLAASAGLAIRVFEAVR